MEVAKDPRLRSNPHDQKRTGEMVTAGEIVEQVPFSKVSLGLAA